MRIRHAHIGAITAILLVAAATAIFLFRHSDYAPDDAPIHGSADATPTTPVSAGVDAPTIDLGLVQTEQPLTTYCELINNTSYSFSIARILPDCRCMTMGGSLPTIAPHSTLRMPLLFNPKGLAAGPFVKRLHVKLVQFGSATESSTITLTLVGHMAPLAYKRIVVLTNIITLKPVQPGSSIVAKVYVMGPSRSIGSLPDTIQWDGQRKIKVSVELPGDNDKIISKTLTVQCTIDGRSLSGNRESTLTFKYKDGATTSQVRLICVG